MAEVKGGVGKRASSRIAAADLAYAPDYPIPELLPTLAPQELAEIIHLATSYAEAERPTLPQLDDEALAAVLCHLSLPQIGAAAAVCAQWAAVLRSDGLLWEIVFAREFRGAVSPKRARATVRRCTQAVGRVEIRTLPAPDRNGPGLTNRAGAAAGSLGPYVVITGGATDGYAFTNTIDVWCPASRSVAGTLSHGRSSSTGRLLGASLPRRWQHSAVAAADGGLILYGGTESNSHSATSAAHVLSLHDANDSGASGVSIWVRELNAAADSPAPAPARTGHTACRAPYAGRDAMLVFGGETQGGEMSHELWACQVAPPTAPPPFPLGCAWSLLQPAGAPPSPRHCHSAELIPPQSAGGAPPPAAWLIFGGWAKRPRDAQPLNQDGTKPFLSDLHVLRLPAMAWERVDAVGAVPRGRCQALCAASDDGEILMVFGGARHSEPDEGQSYGDMVLDLHDAALLHVPTATWLAPRDGRPASCHAQRGGTNALVRHPRRPGQMRGSGWQ